MELERANNALIPYVIEQSPRGERSYDIYSRLLNDRIVFLGEQIDDYSGYHELHQVRCLHDLHGLLRIHGGRAAVQRR